MSTSKRNRETRSIADEHREKELISTSSVTTVLNDIKRKEHLEHKAFLALNRRLEPQNKMCRPCKGEGTTNSGDSCAMCQGDGFYLEDADMRAIELVLKPKFPTTNINLNKDIDDMSTKDLLSIIGEM